MLNSLAVPQTTANFVAFVVSVIHGSVPTRLTNLPFVPHPMSLLVTLPYKLVTYFLIQHLLTFIYRVMLNSLSQSFYSPPSNRHLIVHHQQ